MNVNALLFGALVWGLTGCSSIGLRQTTDREPATSETSHPRVVIQTESWAIRHAIECVDADCAQISVVEEANGNTGWPSRRSQPMTMAEFNKRVAAAEVPRKEYLNELKAMGGFFDKDPRASNFEKVMHPIIWTFAGAFSLGGEALERSPMQSKWAHEARETLQKANQDLKNSTTNQSVISLSSSEFWRVNVLLKTMLLSSK